MLVLREETLYVVDLGSVNGTFVNEQKVAGEQQLADGDRVKIGPLHFRVLIADRVPAAVAAARLTAVSAQNGLISSGPTELENCPAPDTAQAGMSTDGPNDVTETPDGGAKGGK
jgi:predicted component of type VI protein secretion system